MLGIRGAAKTHPMVRNAPLYFVIDGAGEIHGSVDQATRTRPLRCAPGAPISTNLGTAAG
jgi:hypothetical protein